MRRLLREDAQEAELLAIYFEEIAFHEAREEARAARSSSSSSSTSSNTGPGEFSIDDTIGDEEEDDWKDS